MRTIKMLHLNSIWVTHGNVTCTYHMRMSIVKNKKENSSEHSLPLQKELSGFLNHPTLLKLLISFLLLLLSHFSHVRLCETP